MDGFTIYLALGLRDGFLVVSRKLDHKDPVTNEKCLRKQHQNSWEPPDVRSSEGPHGYHMYLCASWAKLKHLQMNVCQTGTQCDAVCLFTPLISDIHNVIEKSLENLYV